MTIYMALFMGMAFTVLAFGADGPFGHIMQGIHGIKGLRLPIDPGYWPLVFLAGMLVAVHFALVAHGAMMAQLTTEKLAKDEHHD